MEQGTTQALVIYLIISLKQFHLKKNSIVSRVTSTSYCQHEKISYVEKFEKKNLKKTKQKKIKKHKKKQKKQTKKNKKKIKKQKKIKKKIKNTLNYNRTSYTKTKNINPPKKLILDQMTMAIYVHFDVGYFEGGHTIKENTGIFTLLHF